jgi:hypothetical protein
MAYADLAPIVAGVFEAVAANAPLAGGAGGGAGAAGAAGLEVLPTGVPVARILIVERIFEDQLLFFPTCTVLLTLLFWVIFRDGRAVLVPFAGVVLSLLYTLGLLAAAGEEVNIINHILPILIFVIGVSDTIHLVARYRRELAAGLSRRAALGRTVRHLAFACLLTSGTTAVGFASLAVAEVSILKRFGLAAAAGVLVAYVTTILFLPLAFSLLSPTLPERCRRADGAADRLAAAFVGAVVRRGRAVAGAGLAISVVALCFAAGVHEEIQLYESFPPDDPVAVANARIEEDFSGIVPVSIAISWAEGADPLAPASLAYIASFQALVEAQENVGNTLSLVDLLAEAGDPSASAAAARALLEGVRAALAATGREGLLARLYAPERRLLRIAAFASDAGASHLLATLGRLRARLEADAPALDALGLRLRVSGDGPVAGEGISRVIGDLFSSLLLAFVFIFAVFCADFRSLRVGAVCMLPNIFPLLLTLGCMGALGMDLRITTVIVFTISLGLAVDDTIHFMVRFREEWEALGREGRRDYAEAAVRTARGTGSAIVSTTLLLSLGFAVLFLSRFPLTATFALCLEVTIVAALVGDLVLLPACLCVLRPFGPEDAAPVASAGNVVAVRSRAGADTW